jgi:uncharacterized repeat protein (TIGR03803 family)
MSSADYGSIFKLIYSGGKWKTNTLVTFDGTSGSYPMAGLIKDSNGNFYGTASQGGSADAGTVFAMGLVAGKWVLTAIYSFDGNAGGSQPLCDLVRDKAGALYGTTYAGGNYGLGTVFMLTQSGTSWNETVLYSFSNSVGSSGSRPAAGLHMDSSGDLFGTTVAGGTYGLGNVFELTQTGGVWTGKNLYSFKGGSDGAGPFAEVIADQAGNLYGTTDGGGTGTNTICTPQCGTTFELKQSGSDWTETVLYDFGSSSTDGYNPVAALRFNGSDALYGTTEYGGTQYEHQLGLGTVFELKQTNGVWAETVLHNFENNHHDGVEPVGAVVVDKAGSIYGTTLEGGNDDLGALYQVIP